MQNNQYQSHKIISKDIIIPTNIFNAVHELKLSRTQTSKAFDFISRIIEYARQDDEILSSFKSFSYGLFLEIFNAKYKTFLNPLLESEIVQCDGIYSKTKGKPYYYRINPDVLKNNVGIKKYRAATANKNNDDKYYKPFMEFYNQLEVPFDDLYGTISKVKSKIIIENFKINDAIPDGDYKILFNGSREKIKKREALEIANVEDMDVIKDGRKLYIDYVDNFIFNKRIHVEVAYIQAIRNLETNNINVKRNKTNNRLEHNFANFPKTLFQLIIEKNGLVEIDAVNSQFALLANKMGSEVDPLFYKHATEGKLYENLQNILHLTRDEVKEVMMQIVYSSPTSYNRYKTKVTKEYPDMMRYVNDFKKGNYKRLAIEMQKMEAGIFIDGVLNKLYEDKITAISKHDSIICFEKDALHVRNTLLNILDDKDFKLTLK